MATPPKKNKKSNGEKPTKWYVVLHLVDGKVKPQREWWREMVIGDEVYFLSPDGDAQVQFHAVSCRGPVRKRSQRPVSLRDR